MMVLMAGAPETSQWLYAIVGVSRCLVVRGLCPRLWTHVEHCNGPEEQSERTNPTRRSVPTRRTTGVPVRGVRTSCDSRLANVLLCPAGTG